MTSITPKNNRWTVVALLFFATTINYIDRQVLGLLKPALEKDLHWSETDYGNVVMAFSAAYALGLLFFGKFVDIIGTKIGYTVSVVIWSIAAMAHAMAGTTMGFSVARGLLGLGESGNFPAAIKAVAEWFPKKERSFATGVFNSGTNIGAVVAPLMVPLVLGLWGWQMAFLITGALGFIWLIFWWRMYEIPFRHARISAAELAYIHADQPVISVTSEPVSWLRLLKVRQIWAYIFGKLFTDPVWWFFLYWIPSYFASTFQLDLKKPSLELAVIYTATTIGSVGGGYLPAWLYKKGWPLFKARKTSMLFFALLVTPVMLAQYVTNIWTAVFLISLAASAHQAWSANMFTTASDMFPQKAVSSVVGIGGMAGSVGGILFPLLVGRLLDAYKAAGDITAGYNLLFMGCSCTYLVAWGLMHVFAPRLEQVEI
jgi:ACS family hexuronate transporter-like MFS transporter